MFSTESLKTSREIKMQTWDRLLKNTDHDDVSRACGPDSGARTRRLSYSLLVATKRDILASASRHAAKLNEVATEVED